jgi:hypothetical protein
VLPGDLGLTPTDEEVRISEQENIARIRSIYEALARGDISYILEQLDPEVEWHAPTSVPFSKGLHRSPAEVGQFFAGIAEHVAETQC